jgi:pimeloyl-ACP methyl ester carboxylesterase
MTAVQRFASHDGTMLAFHRVGAGEPLVCLPGGPARPAGYLGDLGGLSTARELLLLDARGTGASDAPADPSTYLAHRLPADIEALRIHLGLSRLDLLGHSAGAGLALMYAARHPDRVGRLVLVTPGPRIVGLELTPEIWLENLRVRSGEPWFEAAFAEAVKGGSQRALGPFFYGRWDSVAQRHFASPEMRRSSAALAGYRAEGAFDPERMFAGLARLTAPVLVLTGELDPIMPPRMGSRLVQMLPGARLEVQPGASHYPWIDDPARFSRTVVDFLTRERA